jgi:uncharacterized protein YydD (DUF2326 family)
MNLNLSNVFKDVVIGVLPDSFRKNLKGKMLRWGEKGIHDFLETENDRKEDYAQMRTEFLDAAAIESMKKCRQNGYGIKDAIKEHAFIQGIMTKGLHQGDEISAKEVEDYARIHRRQLERRLDHFD